jgi:hypothetical protein
MRIWSVHPKHLDAKGLVALWRETLLARHVLEGRTKGYRHHPQLTRFRNCKSPLDAINKYLFLVHKEASARGYNFDKEKIAQHSFTHLKVTEGQMAYETRHLLNKLKARDPKQYKAAKAVISLDPHPLFKIVPGEIEDWEIV